MLEFMKDYDKLRSGHIPATSFHGAGRGGSTGEKVSEFPCLEDTIMLECLNTHVITFMYHWDPPPHPICLHSLLP